MAEPYAWGVAGATLGAVSLVFCVINAVIMAILYKRLAQSIQNKERRFVTDKFTRGSENSEDASDDTHGVAAVYSDEYDDVISHGISMQPVSPTQQIAYPISQMNGLESYTKDSPTGEQGLISPSFAELKNSLELPLKKVFEKSCTLDNRNVQTPDRKAQTMKSIRPRAQTSHSMMGTDRPSETARTPTGRSGSGATASTPSSTGSPCKNPMAYVVTEIVDANDTKKRPSIRLRECRPRKNLSPAIQKQLAEPEPFYFGLEKRTPSEENILQKEEDSNPSPKQKHDINKGWRQVLPIMTDRNKVFASCDENENNCALSHDKDGQPSRNMVDRDFKYKHKIALKPPPKKARPVLEKSSSTGMQRGGTWSPRTLERHRMLICGPVERSHQRDNNRFREGLAREQPPSPYELVQSPSTLSVRSVACAEDMGCYSKMVRQHDGRRRASSTGSSDVSGRLRDRSYNKLTIGV